MRHDERPEPDETTPPTIAEQVRREFAECATPAGCVQSPAVRRRPPRIDVRIARARLAGALRP